MNIRKTKHQAQIFLICAMVTICGLLLWTAGSVRSMDLSLLSPASFLLSLPATVFAVMCLFHAVMILKSVVREDTPFMKGNIRHLQWIGWLFVAYEPVTFLCQAISNTCFPIHLGNGIHMTTTSSHGGVFLVSGFVILTIASVFRYGMELQQLSDETI